MNYKLSMRMILHLLLILFFIDASALILQPPRGTTSLRRKETRLYKAWYDDDLPNILGINPIEAAIIGGALYYFYGPNTLYEYAREAGRLFSTYAPVVKSVSLDIFSEFRDYLEEDRERESLRKQGIDLTNLPRRTSNIIERVQGAMSLLDQSTKGSSSAEDLQRAYAREDDVPVQPPVSKGPRRSKKEVLQEREVDVDEVMRSLEPEDSAAELRQVITAFGGLLRSSLMHGVVCRVSQRPHRVP